jgi:hypothetical protein
MLRENDCIILFEAMEVKIRDHEDCCHWTLMLRKDLPVNVKTIMAIWSFKRKSKRFPDGKLNKHKARLRAHGGQQTWGLDYWDTYAPVVTWASVQLLLIIAKIFMDSNSRALILFLHSPKPIWTYQSTSCWYQSH